MVVFALAGEGEQFGAFLTCLAVVPLGYLLAVIALVLACRRRSNRSVVFLLAGLPLVADVLTIAWLRHDLPQYGKEIIGGSGVIALLAVGLSLVISRKWFPERDWQPTLDEQAAQWWARRVKTPPNVTPEARRAA